MKVTFEFPDGPITYHLSLELRADGRQSYCLLSPACWYEGQQRWEITLGELKDLAGEVVDEKGQPVADAEVRIAAIQAAKVEDNALKR